MRTLNLFYFIGILIFIYSETSAQTKNYKTNRLSNRPPVINGIIDDPAWDAVEWAGNFVQREPTDGTKPSQNTEFKLMFDDNNLYVVIRAFDSVPEKIVKRLSRRDNTDGDWITVSIDSYSDKQTAFTFGVTAAGVKFDYMNVNDNGADINWDAVYYTATKTDALGWTTEMRIPLSQLRFAKSYEHNWGINIMRYIYRKQEISLWQPIPRTATGYVSLYGELRGLDGIKPRRDLELLPYVNGKASFDKKQEGNPFKKGSLYNGTVGIDGKFAITNDFTLNFTINPDFGQVEADPAVVNLTAFETVYPEKRPFFVEGKNIFSFKLTGADSDNNLNTLFYSRRIGKSPSYVYSTDSGIYVSAPEQTTILGSFKFSGKTRKGLSIGIIESVTQHENAEFDSAGIHSKKGIEPLTNYLIARASQDFNKGTTSIGAIFTATNRKIHDVKLEFLPTSSYTGGLNAIHYWKSKTYYISAKAVFSSINGSKQAITKLQQSPVRYFQRSDNNHVTYNPNLTQINGYGGTMEFGRAGTGNWQYLGYITFRSPGLDFNDVGYLRQADEIQYLFWVRYRKFKPFGNFRWASVNFTNYLTHDFGGNTINKGIDLNMNGQFKNYYTAGIGFNYAGTLLSRGELWGGPALLLPPVTNLNAFAETDTRKKLVLRVTTSHHYGQQAYYNNHKYSLELTYKPIKTLLISLIPQFTNGFNEVQFVGQSSFNSQPRYIMASLTKKIVDLSMRVNVSITPELSVQYYAQPYIFEGKFNEYKRITNPKANEYSDRFTLYSPREIAYNDSWKAFLIDEDKNGVVDYGFYKPDFHHLQYRSNMVLRWEYKTGSSLYLVWSQGRTNVDENQDFTLGQYAKELLETHPRNDFMLKVTYLIVF